jgi:hypothetical protein
MTCGRTMSTGARASESTGEEQIGFGTSGRALAGCSKVEYASDSDVSRHEKARVQAGLGQDVAGHDARADQAKDQGRVSHGPVILRGI